MNFQSGAFGDPAQLRTLILFWTKMELLHYPGAGETRAYLEEELKRQQAVEQMRVQMQGQGMAVPGADTPAPAGYAPSLRAVPTTPTHGPAFAGTSRRGSP